MISAALIWYDERPEDLDRCVRAVSIVADRIVAVDGAYRRYPNAKPSSAPAQADAIRKAAKAVGLGCVIHVPTKLWAGQVAKRTFTMQEAAKDSDWIAVVDTDWVVSGDGEAVRLELAQTGRHVVSAEIRTPAADTIYATGWHRREAGASVYHPHFFRALPGIQVEQRHWWISALQHGNRVWMHYGEPDRKARQTRPLLKQHRLRARYHIDHLFTERSREQILAGRAFCNDRVMVMARTGQEDHVEGLPEPEFDYTTIPY